MICSKSWSVFISCLQFALCLDFLSQFPLALSCSFATPQIAQLTFAFLCSFTSQPREEFLNSFLVALSLSPLTVSGSPPSNDDDDHIPYSQMMISFIHFFGAKCNISDLWCHLMLLFFAVMTEPGRHAAGTLWSPFWRKCFWIQIHYAGIFFWHPSFIVNTQQHWRRIWWQNQIFFVFFPPCRMFQGLINNHDIVVPLPGSLLSLCNSTGKTSSWGCAASVLENKVTRIAQA